MKSAFDFRERLRSPRLARTGEPAKTSQLADLDEWLDRGERPRGPVGEDAATIVSDLKDLFADIAASPTSHAVVAFAGTLLGLAVTLGPALVWSWFL